MCKQPLVHYMSPGVIEPNNCYLYIYMCPADISTFPFAQGLGVCIPRAKDHANDAESARPSMHGLLRLCLACTIPHTPRHPAASYMSNFFKRPRPSSAPYAVYSSGLADLHEGHALWRPEPHASTGEPQIGDVGYMSEGAFIRLFSLNPSLKPEQQVTFWSRPFKPTALLDPEVFRELDRREALRPGHYTSHDVHRLKLSGSLDV